MDFEGYQLTLLSKLSLLQAEKNLLLLGGGLFDLCGLLFLISKIKWLVYIKQTGFTSRVILVAWTYASETVFCMWIIQGSCQMQIVGRGFKSQISPRWCRCSWTLEHVGEQGPKLLCWNDFEVSQRTHEERGAGLMSDGCSGNERGGKWRRNYNRTRCFLRGLQHLTWSFSKPISWPTARTLPRNLLEGQILGPYPT